MSYDDEYWGEEDYDNYEDTEEGNVEEADEPVVFVDPEDKLNQATVDITQYIYQYMTSMVVPIGNRMDANKVDRYVRMVMKH